MALQKHETNLLLVVNKVNIVVTFAWDSMKLGSIRFGYIQLNASCLYVKKNWDISVGNPL